MLAAPGPAFVDPFAMSSMGGAFGPSVGLGRGAHVRPMFPIGLAPPPLQIIAQAPVTAQIDTSQQSLAVTISASAYAFLCMLILLVCLSMRK